MERSSSSPRNRDEEGLLSCWGRLKLRLPWTKRRIISSNSTGNRKGSLGCNIAAALMRRANRRQKPAAGGFKYDPLSYAQNFDEGCWDDDIEDGFNRGFTSRLAPSSSSSPLDCDK
ncbi:hypothetical protein Tsubulata_044063 [Turnera subulata]|uniref:Uncharacterized protein n=1 Tax=Turnera subulata TaxID=218843 RepID=A0A9Q0FTK5_9ROSI|nr:hypothetical protein Tsubulata_044063 [Turnera subulata]